MIHIDGIDLARSVLKCELYDSNRHRPYFHLKGHVAAMGGFLYWELRHDSEDAVCHGYCYRPAGEKYPGSTLYGIFLSISGDDKLDYPVAAKGALRFIGETSREAMQNSIIDIGVVKEEPENILRKRIGGYLGDLQKSEVLRPEIHKAVETSILPNISNLISPDAAPLALFVPR